MAAFMVCRACGESKSSAEFYPRQRVCKRCLNKRKYEAKKRRHPPKNGGRRGWRLGSRRSGFQHGQCTKCEEILPLTAEFFQIIRRRGREEFRQACKRCWDVYRRQYQRGDHHKEYMRNKRATPEHRKYMRAAWRKFHAKPEYKDYDRALYRKLVSTPEGREKERIKVRRRRARLEGATGRHTADDVRVALEVQRGLCFYCEEDVSAKYTVDHLIPLARGGTDGPENIVIACASCNFHKSDKTPEEFSEYLDDIKHNEVVSSLFALPV